MMGGMGIFKQGVMQTPLGFSVWERGVEVGASETQKGIGSILLKNEQADMLVVGQANQAKWHAFNIGAAASS